MRSAEYPPLPQFHSPVFDESADIIFLPVSANGKIQVAAVVELLKDIDIAMGLDNIVLAEYAVAFLFDADATGLTATLEKFRGQYGGHFGDLSEIAHSKWVAPAICPVGVFVFHRTEADETGTLEDHMAPMIESVWPDRYAAACGFIDGSSKPDDKVSRSPAARLKAIITSAGQFDRPGSPLSAMIARCGIPQAQFEASPTSKALVAFLQGAPWRDGQPSSDAA